MTSSRKKPKKTGTVFALLEIENTLINPTRDLLNEELLVTLLEFGIRDLCLLTNMSAETLNTEAPFSSEPPKYNRLNLIIELEKLGFRVHKVITPHDVALHDSTPDYTVGDYYAKNWVGKFHGVNSIPKVDEYAITRDSLIRTLDKQTIDALSKNELKRRHVNKGGAYALTLTQLSKVSKDENITPSSFIVIDHNEYHLKQVQHYANNHKKKLPLTTVQVWNAELDTKQHYQPAFIDHFKKTRPENQDIDQNKVASRIRHSESINTEEVSNAKKAMTQLFLNYTVKVMRTANKDKIQQIQAVLEEIDQTDWPAFRKAIEIEAVLENAFRQAEKDYFNRWRIFARPGAFIKELEKTNAKDFHYPRLLGLLLQKHYEECRIKGIYVNEELEAKVKSIKADPRYQGDTFQSQSIKEKPSPISSQLFTHSPSQTSPPSSTVTVIVSGGNKPPSGSNSGPN